MTDSQKESKVSSMSDRFRSIVNRNFIFNLIPPLILSISAVLVFSIAYRNEFDISLAAIAAVLAIGHGFTVFSVFKWNQSQQVFQGVNFVACLLYLALLTVSFSLDPEAERGRGFAILIFGSSLLFANKYVFSAFGLICAVTTYVAFILSGSDLIGRDLFYSCLVPLVLGFFVCHSRGALLTHLYNLFDEKKKDQENLKRALAEAQKELHRRISYQKKLSQANESFDRLIQVIPQVHWVRKNDKIVFISPSFESVWESSCDKLYEDPNSFLDKVHPADLQKLYQAFECCFDTGKFDEQYRLVMNDGRVKWIHSRSYLDPNDASTEFGVAEDITSKKEIEKSILAKNLELQASLAQLEEAEQTSKKFETENERFLEILSGKQRLESLGLLAGGIAHDFNNILMAVLINIDLLRLGIQQGETSHLDRIEDIEKAALRASEICGQMLQFSGREPAEIQIMELSTQIHDCMRILDSSIPENVEVAFEEPDEKKYIMGASAQVQQILLNLITNAKEAVSDSGKIEIRLSTEKFSAEELAQTYIEVTDFDKEFHVITCRDNGIGMDRKILKRLFEPFFSSKNASRGLGLATVIGIVKGHKGTILVDSQPGQGTEFRILLPAHEVVSNQDSEASQIVGV